MTISRLRRLASICAILMLAAAGANSADGDVAAIESVLNDFHDAAAKADFDRYFGHFTENAVFFGTAPGERWTVEEFKRYARSRFEAGGGWSYTMRERHIFTAPGEDTAWFDEVVESDHYGRCRGSGVLVRTGGRWRISQYNLTIPVPNDFAGEVVLATRGRLRQPGTVVVIRHMEKEPGDDPGLSGEGLARVDRLRKMLVDLDFNEVFSTDTRRTRETAAPFAREAGLEIELYGPHAYFDVASRARTAASGGAALIVGHSNTVPAIIRAFGIEEVPGIDSAEYGHLFLIHLDGLGRATLTHLHF